MSSEDYVDPRWTPAMDALVRLSVEEFGWAKTAEWLVNADPLSDPL